MEYEAFVAFFTIITLIIAAANAFIWGITSLIIVAVLVTTVIGNWYIFKKAGYQGWEALIPYYNSWILAELSMGKGVYMLFSFVPMVGAAFSIYWSYKICLAFGKDIGFTMGYIFLNPVFHLILAFDKSQYVGATKNFWEE